MPYPAGTALGPYEIAGSLGAGGMGEVYRATDTTLKRQVAIKVLPPALATDPDRLARFRREAEVLAALNHPNIAAIYGVERAEGTTALVMELVEGPTLAEAIETARGSRTEARGLPLSDALAIARQIAEALDAAHGQGIIHRDLKPANVKVREDGTVKVLDFGLAKAMEPGGAATAAGSRFESPTLTSPAMTHAGIILGTAAYMSPEQARGRTVDKRADIWAFGCLLYEMVTGERLFAGEDLTETLASVVKDQPDFSKAPPQVVRLLRRCLEKDPRRRLRDLGDAWDLLEEPRAVAPGSSTTPAVSTGRARARWAVAALLAIAFAGVAALRWREAPPAERSLHVFLPPPDNGRVRNVALSPDGRWVVMATPNGAPLMLRSLETGDVRSLVGTDAARTPFWSPDSRTVAFFADGKLQTVPAAGGRPQTLCPEVGIGGGGTWSETGGLVFPSANSSLMRIAAEGGACTPLGPSAPEEQVARLFPFFLPDGQHFLYTLRSTDTGRDGIYVASLSDPAGRRLLSDVSSALFVPRSAGAREGHLVFMRAPRLLTAQPFDTRSLQLTGEPFVISQEGSLTNTLPQIAASTDRRGDLLYVTGGWADQQLIWYARGGKELGREPILSLMVSVRLAPDGKRALVGRGDGSGGYALWLQDVVRHQEIRFTPPSLTPAPGGVWSPDGKFLVINTAEPASSLRLKPADGGADRTLVATSNRTTVSDWSHDGRWLVFMEGSPTTGADIWLLEDPLSADRAGRKPVPWLQTPALESSGQISPDGKWMAFTSDESGTPAVYVRPFRVPIDPADPLWRVSVGSSLSGEPRWRADSKELFYIDYARPIVAVMGAPIGSGPEPVGAPIPLVEFRRGGNFLPENNALIYSPTADGQKFIISTAVGEVTPSVRLILNWGQANQ